MATTTKLKAAILGTAMLGMSNMAHALFVANADGVFNNFGGFDWNGASNAVAVGSFTDGSTVTTTYWSKAALLFDPAGNTILGMPGLNLTYEYTILATIVEKFTCTNILCTSASFETLPGGSYKIWYDTTPDANLVTGAGITDGSLILSGVIDSGLPAGSFTATSAVDGFGIFGFSGSAVPTGALCPPPATQLCISGPLPYRTNASSTLQLGSFTTAWTQATGSPGAGGASVALPPPAPGRIIFQADANQRFVPEPGTMALAGLGLLVAGLRRRKA
jgi:hypothetical protein